MIDIGREHPTFASLPIIKAFMSILRINKQFTTLTKWYIKDIKVVKLATNYYNDPNNGSGLVLPPPKNSIQCREGRNYRVSVGTPLSNL